MNTFRGLSVICLPLVLCIVSCGKSGLEPYVDSSSLVPEPDTCSPISVYADVQGTRALDPIQDLTTLESQHFDVSAVWNYNALPENKWYLKQQEVSKQGTDWVTTPMSYWTVTGNLSFFMYAPSKRQTGTTLTFNAEPTGMPSVSYTPLSRNVSRQFDLCLARPVFNKTRGSGAVPAEFYHTLTQVWFDMNWTGSLPNASYYVLIDQIQLKNVIGTKKVYYSENAPYYSWQPDSECTADSTFTLSRSTNGELKTTYQTPGIWASGTLPNLTDGVFVTVQNSAGRLYLLPQRITTSAVISVTYGFYRKVGSSNILVSSFTKEMNIPADFDWLPNKSYHFQITVDVGESSPVTMPGYVIYDWENSGSTHTVVEFD